MAESDTSASSPEPLRLCDFIRAQRPRILEEWSREARLLPDAQGLSRLRLLDHLPELLDRVANVVETVHTGEHRTLEEIPEVHALDRLDAGFDLEEVANEYALLRACILRLYSEYVGERNTGLLVREILLFNQTFDTAVVTAVARYARTRERTLVALDRLSEAALGTEDLDTFLPKLLRIIAESTESVDVVALLLSDGDTLRARASVGLEEEVAAGFSLKVGEGFAGTVASERRPRELRSASMDPLVKSPILRAYGIQALYGVPLLNGEQVIGVAHMGSRTAFEFSNEDKLLFRAMVSRATGLIVQAQLAARERQAREESERALERVRLQETRTARLQEVTAALSQALTVEQVAQVVVGKAVGALGAASGSMGLLTPDGRHFELLGATGYTPEELRSWQRIPADLPVMFREAVRTGDLVLYETKAAFLADYPHWAGEPTAEDYDAFATLPLKVEDHVLGALGLSFRERRVFCQEERDYMCVLAGQCAQALERARLHEAVVVEITDRKRAEEELRQTAEFRERFLGIVSHDLRNPLNAILLSANALIRSEGIPERPMKSIRRITTSAERMERMISELLDFTRGRLGGGIPIHPRPFNLRHLCRHVLEELEASHPDRELRLEAQGDFQGEWDQDRLAQVLGNLGKNALQYSPANTRVDFVLRDEGDTVRVEVHNEGPPIPAERLSQVFEPFQRAVGEEPHTSSGLGLGLFIVQQIVAAHGGTVEVRSTEAEGTTFTVRLPRRSRPTQVEK
jgi:signal transduction histidine kinase